MEIKEIVVVGVATPHRLFEIIVASQPFTRQIMQSTIHNFKWMKIIQI